jgi:hypothetical protein
MDEERDNTLSDDEIDGGGADAGKTDGDQDSDGTDESDGTDDTDATDGTDSTDSDAGADDASS